MEAMMLLKRTPELAVSRDELRVQQK